MVFLEVDSRLCYDCGKDKASFEMKPPAVCVLGRQVFANTRIKGA